MLQRDVRTVILMARLNARTVDQETALDRSSIQLLAITELITGFLLYLIVRLGIQQLSMTDLSLVLIIVLRIRRSHWQYILLD